jgi:predicted lipoprotein with Yx(FWY)xxD motif
VTSVGAALLAGYGLTGVSAGASLAPQRSTGSKISLASTKDGKALVGANGHSLYTFTSDTKNHSACNAKCAKVWRPATATHKPTAGPGVSAAHLGLTAKHQVTYYGHPLYTYAPDKKAGQVKGEAKFQFGGYWYLTSAKGHIV